MMCLSSSLFLLYVWPTIFPHCKREKEEEEEKERRKKKV